jgi:CheY-like chemotaxis protein
MKTDFGFRANKFIPKNIFLVDDDQKYRNIARMELEKAGHNILFEIISGKMAMEILHDPKLLTELQKVDIALLDCFIPTQDEGILVAATFNRMFPETPIVSISSSWSGEWEDPLFNPDNMHPKGFNNYDCNGRTEMRGPDYHLFDVDRIYRIMAEDVGRLRFSLRNESKLSFLEQFANIGKER